MKLFYLSDGLGMPWGSHKELVEVVVERGA